MRRHVFALIIGASIALAPEAKAQNSANEFLGFDLPKELRAYTDEAAIMSSMKTVLALLKSAQFSNNSGSFTSGGKTYEYDYSLQGDCDAPEVRAFYRGLHLAHMAYNLFLSKQEVGWPEDQGAIADPPRNARHFASGQRNVLFRYWSSTKLSDLFLATLALLDLGEEQKSDLIAFLSKLREFRHHHDQLAKMQVEVDRIFARENPAFYYEKLYDEKVLNAPVAEAGLTYQDLSKELRELINRTREPGVSAISQCLVSEAPFRLTVGEGEQIVSVRLFVPVKYMISFWRRRAAEGTENFADAVIARLLLALRDKQQ